MFGPSLLWLGLVWGCGEEPRDTTVRTVLTPEEIAEKTVRTRDDWSVPKTTILPLVDDTHPVIVEAEVLFQQGQHVEAAERLLKLIESEPELVTAHSFLSAVLIQLGDLQQAIVAAETVVELAPSAWSYCNLGTVYILDEQFEQAKGAFEQALRIDPKYFLAFRNLGSIAYQEKRYADAEMYFQRFIRIDPEDTYAYVAYGQVLAEQGKLEAAKEVYLYRLQELEWDAESHRRTPSGLTLDLPLALAEIYRRQGQTEEAMRWFLQTLSWSWVYQGHWASEASYADKAYQRMVAMLQSLPHQQRVTYKQQWQGWFMEEKQQIPVLERDSEEAKFVLWLQLVEDGP